MPIQIITATPGPTTAERIFELLLTHPQGMTVKDFSQRLNRPVSMVQHCLKHLLAAEAVCARLSEDGRQWLYYPSGNRKAVIFLCQKTPDLSAGSMARAG